MTSPATVKLVERPSGEPRRTLGGFGLTSLWALYGLTFRQHLHGKRWIVMTGLFMLPVGLAILIRAVAPDVPLRMLEFILAYMFVPQALLPLVALVYASGIIQDEQEEQTLTYLLIRPIPKWAIYAVKLLATLTTTIALTAIFVTLTYTAIYLGGDTSFAAVWLRCLKTIGIHSLGVAAYCCLFGLMSLMTKRTLIVGILYSALVEGLLANLPFGIRLITVIYYTRLIAYRALDFAVTHPQGKVDVAAEAWQFEIVKDPGLTEHPSLRSCMLILSAASVLFTLFAAYLCARREFHVKTPAGS